MTVPRELFHPSPASALAALCVAGVALATGSALAAESGRTSARITSVAGVDAGAGSNAGNTTATNKRRDSVAIDSVGAALERVDVTWERGVAFRAVPQQRAPRLIGRLTVLQVKDPGADVSYDDIAQAPTITTWNVWLRADEKGRRLALWFRGAPTSITGKLDATSTPKLRIRGLPERTVSVSFGTASRLGVGILSLRPGDTPGPRVQTRVSGVADGGSFALIAEDESGLTKPPR